MPDQQEPSARLVGISQRRILRPNVHPCSGSCKGMCVAAAGSQQQRQELTGGTSDVDALAAGQVHQVQLAHAHRLSDLAGGGAGARLPPDACRKQGIDYVAGMSFVNRRTDNRQDPSHVATRDMREGMARIAPWPRRCV